MDVEDSSIDSCFLCGSCKLSVQRCPHDISRSGDIEPIKEWKSSYATSLCNILEVEYEAFHTTFASAPFCVDCQELVCQADFTVNAILRLNHSLGSIREQLKNHVRDYYKKAILDESNRGMKSIRDVVIAMDLKVEDNAEELQTAQFSELSHQAFSDRDLPGPMFPTRRLKELKLRQAEALKLKATARKILYRKQMERSISTGNNEEVAVSQKQTSERISSFRWKSQSKFEDTWNPQRHLRTTGHRSNLTKPQIIDALSKESISLGNVYSDDSNADAADSNERHESENIKRAQDPKDFGRNSFPPCADKVPQKQLRLTSEKSLKRNHECPLCNARFRDDWKLKRHLQSKAHDQTKSFASSDSDSRSVPCSHCDKKFKSEEVLSNHIRNNHREHYYNCVFCPAKHSNRGSYMVHLDENHLEKKIHLCQVCGKTFFFLNDLRYHWRYHQDDGKQSVQCTVCNMRLPSEVLLKSHVLSRHPDGGVSSMYTCPAVDCNLRFSTAAGLQAHVRYLHEKRNDFECPFSGCGKRFGLKTKLEIHVVTHSVGTHLCPSAGCGKKYRHKKDLKAHAQRCHPDPAVERNPGQDKYQCPVCPNTYFRKDILRRHIVLKCHYGNDEKPVEGPLEPPPEAVPIGKFECHICGSTLVDEAALRRHYFTHDQNESRPHACPQCQKRFGTEEKLAGHVKRLHGDGAFGCQVCGKRFDKSKRVRLHMLSHSDFREHACEFCGKEYKHQRDLMLHVKREHTTVETAYRFQCPVCDKKFHRSDILRYHQINKHGITAPAGIVTQASYEAIAIVTCTPKPDEGQNAP